MFNVDMERSLEKDAYLDDQPATLPDLMPISANLEGAEIAQLMELRARIDAKLPALSLSEINIEAELLLQLASLKDLNIKIAMARDIPTNQKAQVANSITSALRQLIDKQLEVYTSERFKRIEILLIKHMKLAPKELSDAFLNEFRVGLGEMNV